MAGSDWYFAMRVQFSEFYALIDIVQVCFFVFAASRFWHELDIWLFLITMDDMDWKPSFWNRSGFESGPRIFFCSFRSRYPVFCPLWWCFRRFNNASYDIS